MADIRIRRQFHFKRWAILVALVLLAIAGAYVANEARFVAARKDWLARHTQVWDGNGLNRDFDESVPDQSIAKPRSLPLIRRLFGDEYHDWLVVSIASEEPQARKLFPEAETIFVK
jgi:hypothetical protein